MIQNKQDIKKFLKNFPLGNPPVGGSVEMSNDKRCFVPYGTKGIYIFINSTDLSFLTPA
jgi:hypothetical protein